MEQALNLQPKAFEESMSEMTPVRKAEMRVEVLQRLLKSARKKLKYLQTAEYL